MSEMKASTKTIDWVQKDIFDFVHYGKYSEDFYNALEMLHKKEFSYIVTPKKAGFKNRWLVAKHLMRFVIHKIIAPEMDNLSFSKSLKVRFNKQLKRATVIFLAESQLSSRYNWTLHLSHTGIDFFERRQFFSIKLGWERIDS